MAVFQFQDPIFDEASKFKKDPNNYKDPVNKPMDQATIDALVKVAKQIEQQNRDLKSKGMLSGSVQSSFINTANWSPVPGNAPNIVQGTNYTVINFTPWPAPNEATEAIPNPNIDMELDIYKNEFEAAGAVLVGDPSGVFIPNQVVEVGLIDSVSEEDDDLYAKFPDGEIMPFNGHPEKFTITLNTWNDIKRSELTGNEVRKAVTCRIYLNDTLARIIEGTDIQELLKRADRAIDQLKVQPFSICRDKYTLTGREIYYDNQPAIIQSIDEQNNLIYIVPDTTYIKTFYPPVYVIEDDETDEWIKSFGPGMYVHDYDEKIWWWRNTKGNNIDPNTDPFYGQFPHPVKPSLEQPPNYADDGANPVVTPGIYPLHPIDVIPYTDPPGTTTNTNAYPMQIRYQYATNPYFETYTIPGTNTISTTVSTGDPWTIDNTTGQPLKPSDKAIGDIGKTPFAKQGTKTSRILNKPKGIKPKKAYNINVKSEDETYNINEKIGEGE